MAALFLRYCPSAKGRARKGALCTLSCFHTATRRWVGNSGGGALGLRSGNYVGRGPLQPAVAVFRWRSCRKNSVNSALPR
jgi:hypothetical protein